MQEESEKKDVEEQKPQQKPEKVEPKKQPVEKQDAPEEHLVMDITIRNSLLRTIITAISSLKTEALIQVSPKGWKIEEVDNAHVCMCAITLNSKACEEYKADELELGIDLEKLDKLIKLASGDCPVNITYDNQKGNCIWIQFENVRRRMGLIDSAGMPKPKIPKLEVKAVAVLPAGQLMKSFKTCELISDHMRIVADKKDLTIGIEEDSDKTDMKWELGEGSPLSKLEVKDKSKAMYSLDYMEDELKVTKSDTLVQMKFSTDSPMELDYSFNDGGLHILYLTAPRIESE